MFFLFVEGGFFLIGMLVLKVKLMLMYCFKFIFLMWFLVMYFNSGDWFEVFRLILNCFEELEWLVIIVVCGRGIGLLM